MSAGSTDYHFSTHHSEGADMNGKNALGRCLLLWLVAAAGCGVTRSSVVNPANGRSMSVAQRDSLCAVELVSGYYFLVESNTESCFLTTATPSSLVPVDCAKLKRNYSPAAKCIGWLDAEGRAIASTPLPQATPPLSSSVQSQ